MKKIFDRLYPLFIYIFFALYMIVLHIDGEEKNIIFAIGIILGSIMLAIILL